MLFVGQPRLHQIFKIDKYPLSEPKVQQKGLELLRNNWAKPMQKCLPTIFFNKKMQLFLIPMLIEEYQIIFSTL